LNSGVQLRALEHVASLSSGPPLDRGLPVTLNFHPDRYSGTALLLDRLASDGVYLSQFVTGTSNGGLTAFPGGDRWHWEHRIFAGAYDHAPAQDRPVYGALDFRRRGTGGAPRFGSSYFRLIEPALDRTTFCFPDSADDPEHFGVASGMGLITLADASDRDLLDDYIEAQVHGGVRLDRDVAELVLDPSFADTEVESAARRLPCPIGWHRGFACTLDDLLPHSDYRGQEIIELAARIAVDGHLNPRIIGRAYRAGGHDPQQLKKVWHCLARFGAPDPQIPAKAPGPAKSA